MKPTKIKKCDSLSSIINIWLACHSNIDNIEVRRDSYDPEYELEMSSKTGRVARGYIEAIYANDPSAIQRILDRMYNQIMPFMTYDSLNSPCERLTLTKPGKFDIKKVIFNDPCTIVLWEDGTKTIVRCQEDDIYDPEKGLAMAIAKKAFDNKGRYFDIFKKWVPEKEEAGVTIDTKLDFSDINISDIVENISKALLLKGGIK